jgi:hypothetical protein
LKPRSTRRGFGGWAVGATEGLLHPFRVLYLVDHIPGALPQAIVFGPVQGFGMDGEQFAYFGRGQLSQLMIDHDVGVSTVSVYPVKKVDADYFEESI